MDQKVLIIDAHPVYIHKLEGFLKGLTFHDVVLTQSGGQGIAAAAEHKPRLVILSGMLPDMASEKVCEAVKQNCGAKVIVQVGLFTDEESMERLKAVGADAVLARKEKDMMPLQKAVESLLTGQPH
jgi:DNA-binding NarL/FixJ family response regulator